MAKAKSDGSGMSKMDMVRNAIEALGPDAKPKQLRQHIKDNHGVDMGTTMISSYKSNIAKKGGAGGGRGGDGDVSVGVRDLTTLRQLIDKVGAPQLQTLIKVLSR
jgi:hypothetical protein